MISNYSFTIYNSVSKLPNSWDEVAIENKFLQTAYLSVLEESAPTNMQCFFVGIFEDHKHIGVALAQYLNLNKLESFGERDKCFKTAIRNLVFKNFASHVLFMGNNMITGQNGFAFSKKMTFETISKIILECAHEITDYFKKQSITIHIITFKDFYQDSAEELKKYSFNPFYEFSTQPNMIMALENHWKTNEDYIGTLTKKYRDQFKRSQKKCEGVEIRELDLEEIEKLENRIYDLYHFVAKHAPFNTFFLAKNHFTIFKKQLEEKFIIVGYFLDDKLVGFHTLLLNGNVLETYFLGYDEQVQKEKMLYLNMLYNMTFYAIQNQFKKIIFGRTALEIKSSIGAEPITMSGFLYHKNKLINKYIDKIFKNLEPELVWQQRHPFK